MKGLTEFLLPNKELLKNHYMKYVKNGVIDANAIHSDTDIIRYKKIA